MTHDRVGAKSDWPGGQNVAAVRIVSALLRGWGQCCYSPGCANVWAVRHLVGRTKVGEAREQATVRAGASLEGSAVEDDTSILASSKGSLQLETILAEDEGSLLVVVEVWSVGDGGWSRRVEDEHVTTTLVEDVLLLDREVASTSHDQDNLAAEIRRAGRQRAAAVVGSGRVGDGVDWQAVALAIGEGEGRGSEDKELGKTIYARD